MPATAAGRVALYRAVLADKQVLIILDNVGHPDQVRPLLPPIGPAQLLVTSRNALASLVTIDFARTMTLEPLSSQESLALLNMRLGDALRDGGEHGAARDAWREALAGLEAARRGEAGEVRERSGVIPRQRVGVV